MFTCSHVHTCYTCTDTCYTQCHLWTRCCKNICLASENVKKNPDFKFRLFNKPLSFLKTYLLVFEMFCAILKSLNLKSGLYRVRYTFGNSLQLKTVFKTPILFGCTSLKIGCYHSKTGQNQQILEMFCFFKEVCSHTFEIKALITPLLNWI